MASTLTAALIFLDEDSEVRIRCAPNGKPTSLVEDAISEMHDMLPCGITHYQWHPSSSPIRTVWERDKRMVEGADRVIAFFPEGRFMVGGTAHVVECALRAGVPTEVWVVDGRGEATLVAEDDGVAETVDSWTRTRALASHILAYRSRVEAIRSGTP